MKKILALILIFAFATIGVSAETLFAENRTLFEPLQSFTNMYDCTISDSFASFITASKNVKTLGYNQDGQLGVASSGNTAELIDIPGINNIIKVESGEDFVIALTQVGKVYAWGKNDRGQLGIGNNVDMKTPVPVNDLASVMDIAVGDNFALAVKYDGTVWAWGANEYGQLGLGDKEDRNLPTQISSLATSAAVYAGNAHAAVFTGAAKIFVWGKNDFGQLGLGHTNECMEPVAAPEFQSGIDFAFGDDFSAVLKGSGVIYVCGKNDEGQLGLGHYDDVHVLTPINSLRQIAAIDAGRNHMAAFTYSSVVYTWGSNKFGQLGTGDLASSNVPVKNALSKTKTDIKCGGYSTVVATGAGPVYYAGNFVSDDEEVQTLVIPEKPESIQDIGILIDNEWFITDVEPIIINGRTMLPMRAVFEEYGATLDWNDSSKTATATLGDKVVSVSIGGTTAYVNGTAKELDTPAVITNDRTLVPVRFISEALGFKVEWDGEKRVVIITK